MKSTETFDSRNHWAGLKEAGTYQGLLLLLWVYKVFGRQVFNVALYFVMVYFYVFNPIARNSSKDYLATHYRAYPGCWGKRPRRRDVIRHMLAFGQSILDKCLAWTRTIEEDEFIIVNEPELRKLLEDSKGQLIIGSHLGNLEYCRGFVHRYKNKTINVLVYDQHSANFVNMMQRTSPDSRMHIYQVDGLDIPTILRLKEKIDRGEWLFIAGDRVPLSGEQRTVNVDFMGRVASFPIGPYMLAKVLRCNVKLMFSYRVGDRVRFEMVPFSDQVVLQRKSSNSDLRRDAQQFAAELERQCVNAPFQWFNFYPYWLDQQVSKSAPEMIKNKQEGGVSD